VSTWFYNTVLAVGTAIFWQTSSPVVLHKGRVPRTGAFILAANHVSSFDPALLIRHTPRKLNFLTSAELCNGRMGWFFRGMNSIPLDRGRVDGRAVRASVEHLAAGRVVGVFPEGRVRAVEQSAVIGAPFGAGAVKLARLSGVPIVPAVIWNTMPYARWTSWLPTRSVRYGLIYGPPFETGSEEEGTRVLGEAFRELYRELARAMSAGRYGGVGSAAGTSQGSSDPAST
jgi:1-acyl-sn-glycerol-3-phosphate acyltransferase